MHNHHNGLKTAALFGVLWAVLLGLGGLIGVGTRSSAPIWMHCSASAWQRSSG